MISFTIAGNELRRLFQSPLAWTILALVQFLLAVFFFILLSQYLEPAGWQAGRGLTEIVVAGVIQVAGILMLLVVPFLTMRLFSEEQRSGSIKLLLSAPISITEMVLGKYLGAVCFLFCLLALTALMPLTLLLGTPLDVGLLASGLFGLALLMLALASIGLFASSLTQQPAVAGISAFGISFILWIAHLGAGNGNEKPGELFNYLSLLKHYDNLLSGAFNSVDVIYYLLVSVTFLVLTIWRLDAVRTQQ